ncbi:MAG: LysR substrate-binding domain-containing protein [Vicinamibacterales bacterium]
MELRHLRYFVALAECLNFTRAAERVHVTQSTLSHQIKQLEDEIGKPLFERIGKRVAMTAQGELFLGHAKKALSEIDQGVGALKETNNGVSGQLHIGATHTFNLGFIPECIAVLLTLNPTLQVTTEELPAEAIRAKLVDGELDVGISYRPQSVDDLWFEPLYNEELVLVVAPTHPMARRKRIRMIELHRQPLVLLTREFATRTMLDECFRSCGAEPNVTVEMNTVAPMLSLVARAPMGAIVSENALHDLAGLHVIPLESPTPMRTPGILWKRHRELTATMESFASIVRKVALKSRLRKPSA